MTDAALATPPRDGPLWRRALPFVVGGGLFAWVASRIDWHAFREAVSRTNYVAFGAFALVFMAAVLAADVFATTYVYRRTVAPVRYRDLFVIRAASYLPSLLNHHLGQAWLTYFVARTYRAPIGRAAGATLLVYATTLGGLFGFLLLGISLGRETMPWLVRVVVIGSVAGVVYLVVLAARPRFFTSRPVVAPLFDAGVSGHLRALAVRLPHVFVQFLGAWVPFLLFGVDIPFVEALAVLPILMFAVTLPVSPQGLGTRDALALALLSGYAHGTGPERSAAIAGATLSWFVAITVIQLAVSPLFLKRAHALLGNAA